MKTKKHATSTSLLKAVAEAALRKSKLFGLVVAGMSLASNASASWFSERVAPVVNEVTATVKEITPVLSMIPGMAPIMAPITAGVDIFANVFGSLWPPKTPPAVVGQPVFVGQPVPVGQPAQTGGTGTIESIDAEQICKVSLDNSGGIFTGNMFSARGGSIEKLKLDQKVEIGHATVREGGTLTGNEGILNGVESPAVQLEQILMGKALDVGSQATVVGNRATLSGRMGYTKIFQLADFGTMTSPRGKNIGNDFIIVPPAQAYRAF